MLEIFGKFFDFCGEVNKRKFYKSLVLSAAYALMEAMKIPAVMLLIWGALENSVTPRLLWECFVIIAASVIIGSVVKHFVTMLQCEAGYYTAAGKRIEIAEHMRYLPMGYFSRNSLGQITSVTTNTMEQLADVATRVVMLTTQGILTTFMMTLMVFAFDWRIGIADTVGIALFFMANRLLQTRSRKLSPIKMDSDTELVDQVLEYVQGITEVRSYNLTGRASRRLNRAIEKNRGINTEMELKFIPLMQLQTGIIKLTGVVMTLLSVYFYLNGAMSLLYCIGMMICSFLVLDSLGNAGNYSSLLRIVDLAVDKGKAILDLPEMDIDGKEIVPENHDVEISHVDFCYDKNFGEQKTAGQSLKIIDDVSVRIPEHKTTAIVGPSGGGKTTLCHLIARFWDVDKGSITLGGEDVRNYSMDSLMKNFSFVFQNVYLFQSTIADNIRFGRQDAPMERVIEAAEKACCHDFITALPDGYETVIGEGGATLSGGERQRISIARAIMRDAPVIILDEATANVDPENERELMDAVDALTKEKTIIMIAHRLKTVRNADRILVLDHGRIVQTGRHEELLREEGVYKRFVESRELAANWKL